MRFTNWTVSAVVLLSFILLLSAGEAGASGRGHDSGFFVRLSTGFGYASSKIEEGDISYQLSGGTGDANLAFGGMVTPHLALHATLLAWVTTSPELKYCDGGRCDTETFDEIDFSLSGFGGGVTYYFMPSNFYLSGSICAAELTVTHENRSESSDYGPAIDITVGKEWWVSDSWGLGVAGGFGYHSVSWEYTSSNWSGTSFGIRFSATYN